MQKSKRIFITAMALAANVAFGAHANHGWKDVTLAADGSASTCAQTPANCAYLQLSSGLIFTGFRGKSPSYKAADTCRNLNLGGEEGWWLPLFNQMEAASDDHIANIAMPNTDWNVPFISSTVYGGDGEADPTYLATFVFATGDAKGIDAHDRSPFAFLCVKYDLKHIWKDVTKDSAGADSSCASTPTNCTFEHFSNGLRVTGVIGKMDWYQANGNTPNGCFNLKYNGKTGWRLPEESEIQDIFDLELLWLDLPGVTNGRDFWSATTSNDDSSEAIAMSVEPDGPYCAISDSKRGTKKFVICVQ